MNNRLAVVTGGGSGLGRALCHALADRGLEVLAVGRRQAPLTETCRAYPERIRSLSADVATESGRDAIAAAVGGQAVAALVHNAGVLEPVAPLERISLQDWRHSQAINVEAPLFLTQLLLPWLRDGRVLHISSGAAHSAYSGWGAYCTGKAALYMLYQVWSKELVERGVAVGSVRPGVVDTPMQTLLRQQRRADFPAIDKFLDLHSRGKLEDPKAVAGFISWLLLDVGTSAFARTEWTFTDPEQQAMWRRGDAL
ncbi:SDR family NAD(P)-dependent oxidoreductase [Methylonatrum kenyense]|uniref:SDR family NAD(P)-dependent oxidoreductase n=1 Tax=Methylonatrum kenyense TaxID=455253 RepID=UPI0020BFDC49|nr:SDR family NAD(P)-dependent oxidoreductase [Methylonatrum kenyense]MCK8515488.1 SDR family NAD(P)-dependent oxidoreductase [Methylonatrum kenyense]